VNFPRVQIRGGRRINFKGADKVFRRQRESAACTSGWEAVDADEEDGLVWLAEEEAREETKGRMTLIRVRRSRRHIFFFDDGQLLHLLRNLVPTSLPVQLLLVLPVSHSSTWGQVGPSHFLIREG